MERSLSAPIYLQKFFSMKPIVRAFSPRLILYDMYIVTASPIFIASPPIPFWRPRANVTSLPSHIFEWYQASDDPTDLKFLSMSRHCSQGDWRRHDVGSGHPYDEHGYQVPYTLWQPDSKQCLSWFFVWHTQRQKEIISSHCIVPSFQKIICNEPGNCFI